MRYALLALSLFAAGCGGSAFAISETLPDIARVEVPETPAVVSGCKPGCNCKRPGCNCGAVIAAASCATPAGIDESLLRTVQAQGQDATRELTGYAPAWCIACPAYMARLGNGDSLTRIRWVKSEAPFTPPAYPCLHDPTTNKMLCGSSISDTMDRIRQSFGIVPKTEGHVAALNVGKVPRSSVTLFLDVLGDRGNRVQGPKPYTRELPLGIATMPAGSETRWQRTGDVVRIDFTKRPRWQLGPVNQDLAAVVIDRNRIAFELPYAPDVEAQIVD